MLNGLALFARLLSLERSLNDLCEFLKVNECPDDLFVLQAKQIHFTIKMYLKYYSDCVCKSCLNSESELSQQNKADKTDG